MQDALTDQSYWEAVWQFTGAFAATPTPRINDAMTDRFLQQAFAAHLGPGRRFVEIAAGGSPWPAWVAAVLGAEAWGIDFSRAGLALAARAVAPGGARVTLVEGDLFDPEKLPEASFDVVYSGGFIERFSSPRPVMERLADLLTPGGVVVTIVPNLCGINGALQKLVDRDIFHRHISLPPASLDAAHATAGLVPVEPARYLDLVDLGTVNLTRVAMHLPRPMWHALSYALTLLRRAGLWYGVRLGAEGGRWWAPMLGGVYCRAHS